MGPSSHVYPSGRMMDGGVGPPIPSAPDDGWGFSLDPSVSVIRPRIGPLCVFRNFEKKKNFGNCFKMKTFRPLSPPSLSTRFTSPGITPSIGNSSDDDATEELIRSQVRRIKQRSARRSHPHRSVFLDSSSGSSDESAQDLTRSQANHVEQV